MFKCLAITFLLSYQSQLAATKELFDRHLTLEKKQSISPWDIHPKKNAVWDKNNHIYADPQSLFGVETPIDREKTGFFTKTHNPLGGFTTTACDRISQKFIQHAGKCAKHGGKALEIGAAFGAATLESVTRGATVFCNDLEPRNLAVVRKRFLEAIEDEPESITGDSDQLIFLPGAFPEECIGLPENHFDASLICRVLHFFSGIKIEESLTLLYKLLVPGGKIYLVCETPYLKNWQSFIPEFKKRVSDGMEWPGEITNPQDFESSGRAQSLPQFVHWMTKEVLERSLTRAGFFVEQCAYINRQGQFPGDLLLPEEGKESVGAIGVKL
jgi:ubiquinone/menaquinone biosynthesis C-methylase UbiE